MASKNWKLLIPAPLSAIIRSWRNTKSDKALSVIKINNNTYCVTLDKNILKTNLELAIALNYAREYMKMH